MWHSSKPWIICADLLIDSIRDCDPNCSHALLDDDFHAKVSDFGLAMLGQTRARQAGSSRNVAPEHFGGVGWTKAVHVYSFGVVLMEPLTGRPAVVENQDLFLVTWFREEDWIKLGSEALHAAMDPHLVLGLNFHSDESTTVKSILAMAKLAMDCTAENPKARPDMDMSAAMPAQ